MGIERRSFRLWPVYCTPRPERTMSPLFGQCSDKFVFFFQGIAGEKGRLLRPPGVNVINYLSVRFTGTLAVFSIFSFNALFCILLKTAKISIQCFYWCLFNWPQLSVATKLCPGPSEMRGYLLWERHGVKLRLAQWEWIRCQWLFPML